MVLSLHWVSVGHEAPRICRKLKRMIPETKKRKPAIRKGGIVSTATRMPKYVLPQIR